MGFGGLHPSPYSMGGGSPSLEQILDSLAAQIGPAYDTAEGGIVYVELMAEARAIHAIWKQNERLGNQWIGAKMTDFLPRWEKIYRIAPRPTATLPERRARVTIAQARAGRCDSEKLYEVCQTILGDAFVSIVNLSSATANVYTPTGWPMGSHSAAIDWLSTVAHVAVKVAQPSTMDDGDFYDRCGDLVSELDLILPAWVTFDWFREGPSGAGFFLDETNLDNEAFD